MDILSDSFVVLTSCVFGCAGWILHSAMIASSILPWFKGEKWTIVAKYNEFGEGIPELIIFPLVSIFCLYGAITVIHRTPS